MSTFQSAKIKSVCEKVASGGTPSRKRADYFTDTGGHLWVKSKELLEKGITDTEEKITEEGLQNSSAKFYPANTVLVAMYGVNAGQLGWLEKPATVNQAICALVVDPKKADWRFVYYSLFQNRQNLISQARGGAQPNLNKEMVENFEIPMTSDLPTQTRVASVISAYDDLIENNEKRIKALEEMAQLLYTEWFVKFKFPTHEKVKLIDSGTEYGKIPEGWEVKTLAEVASIVRGCSYSSEEIDDFVGDYYIVNLKSFNRGGGFRFDGAKYFSGLINDNQTLSAGDIVVAVTDMTNDRAVIARPARVPEIDGKITFSADVVKINSDVLPNSFLYEILSSYHFTEKTKQKANGANVLHLKPAAILEFVVLIPDVKLLKEFAILCEPAINEVDKLVKQNDVLTKTRVLLIPQLVTGRRELK